MAATGSNTRPTRRPASIHNPRTGQRMTFLDEPGDGSALRIDSLNPPTAAREPEHIHPFQESRATVHAGRLIFEVRGERRVVGPGETIVIPAGAPHRFWNDGTEDARSTQEFRPALNARAFFETYFRLEAENHRKGRSPSLLQMAVLLPAYSRFIRPTRPPWPVLAALSIVLAPVGRLLGYRASFPDAD